MSATTEPTPAAGSNGGVPWRDLATWALGAIVVGACWVFNSTVDDLKKAIEKQGDELAAIHRQIADARLDLVQKIDAVDKNLTAADGKIDALNVSLTNVAGYVPRPQPPAPQPRPKGRD